MKIGFIQDESFNINSVISMSETLGSLCDKLTIVKLKQYHSEDPARLKSLGIQEKQLCDEIDDYLLGALSGIIPNDKLTFEANKVYKKEGNETKDVLGSIAEIFSDLARINCELWHEVEKGYEIEKVPTDQKDVLVKQLAILNLQRNKCIDAINKNLQTMVS
jgi:hypothetical protein